MSSARSKWKRESPRASGATPREQEGGVRGGEDGPGGKGRREAAKEVRTRLFEVLQPLFGLLFGFYLDLLVLVLVAL